MCDNTRLLALTNQAITACHGNIPCIQGAETAVTSLRDQQCQEPLLSRCVALNPYGTQDKGYVYGCQGVTRDVLQNMSPGNQQCDSKVINQVWQNGGTTKCGANPGTISKGECLFGMSAAFDAVLDKNNCSPYHSVCTTAGSAEGFTSCNNVMRSYFYGQAVPR